ncbi:aldo/keto reductase [Pseudoduganella sp. DS3]|uniref:Aldo/keto reductase n=1 Tax=Pseudoduganella guangdongensis TaxID=2692179 RepID=A0A6N9HLB3_9BURK|nr:aldo/keto reductase [Pseudoduganella guangdongensis]MYN03983.1 aldo/keto reductase [Pseudoduganella guangdongensis]
MTLSRMGQGTWNMGERPADKAAEVRALQLGLDLGMTVIDTAEMYADGGAEQVVGEAIAGRRSEAYLVSKVLPQNASRKGVVAACEQSLKRMKVEHIDLYLLHWPGSIPLAETLEGLMALKKAGKIHEYGVSNFDLADMKAADALPGGDAIEANQVLYNLRRRGAEWDLLPWCEEHGVLLMAYSPLESDRAEQARLLAEPALQAVAARHQATPAQIALAWLLRRDGVMPIPKAVSEAHVRANAAAMSLRLDQEDLAVLDRSFSPPRRATPLDVL